MIAIADLDFIGEQFFELRRRKIEDLEFDNVPFVLNCVDVLAGDESFVRLRRKRPVHRRLDALEARAKEFDKVLAEKTKQAEDMASRAARSAQKAFEKQVDAVQAHAEWDERTKEIQLANIQRVAQRRLDVAKHEHRRQEAQRDSRGEGRVGAADSRHPQRRSVRGGDRSAAASAYPGAVRVDQAADARERGSQSRSGWSMTSRPE